MVALTKEQMIEFLDTEAELVVQQVFPKILEYIEITYIPQEQCIIPMYRLISKDIPPNRAVLVVNKIVQRLVGLNYKAFSRNGSRAGFMPEVVIE